MKFKKTLTVGLCAALCFTSLAGCDAKKDSENVTQESSLTLNGDKIYPVKSDAVLTYWQSVGGSVK